MPSNPRLPFWAALLIVAVLFGVLPSYPAFAARWYVDSGGSGDGSSWEKASPDLASVLKDAAEGDEIWVAEGVYKPAYDSSGKKVDGNTRTFALKSGMKLYGGFPTGGAPNLENRDAKAFPSVLDGDGAYHTVYAKDLTEEVKLSGFTVTGGRATAASGEVSYGGGLYCYKTTLKVEDCAFRENSAKAGGGVYASNSKIFLSSCFFMDNSFPGSRGGGLMLDYSEAEIENCSFNGNVVTSALKAEGGGLCLAGSQALIRNSSFTGNSAEGATGASGGALYLTDNSSAELQNCTISGNEATASGIGNGGGLYVAGSKSSLIMVNCTVSGNRADKGGGALHLVRGTARVVNCIIFGNQGERDVRTDDIASPNAVYIHSSLLPETGVRGPNIISDGDIYDDPRLGGLTGGEGPLFMMPSPRGAAINAGLPPGEHPLSGNTITVPAQDQRGFPRPSGGGTDLGACEVQWYALSLFASGTGEGLVEAEPGGVVFSEGAEVTLTAKPGEGFVFSGWEGDMGGRENPAILIMDGSKTVFARFEPPTAAGESSGKGATSGEKGGCCLAAPPGLALLLALPALLLTKRRR